MQYSRQPTLHGIRAVTAANALRLRPPAGRLPFHSSEARDNRRAMTIRLYFGVGLGLALALVNLFLFFREMRREKRNQDRSEK